jgi:hypothetical protein
MQAEVAQLKTELAAAVAENPPAATGNAVGAGPTPLTSAPVAPPVPVVLSVPVATPTARRPPANQTPRDQAERAQDGAIGAEIAAIKKLDFENNRLTALLNIAHRPNLSPTMQAVLIEAAFNDLEFESNKVALLGEIIKRPDFSPTARSVILSRLGSLDFENNRMAILDSLNQKH